MFAQHVSLGCLDRFGDVRLAGLAAFIRRVVVLGRQFLCGLRGHAMTRHLEPARLSLRCEECGATTPGWVIDVNPAFRIREQPRARIHRGTAAFQEGSRREDKPVSAAPRRRAA